MKFEATANNEALGTGMTFNIAGAPDGSDVFLWALSGSNSNTITLPGWSSEQNRSAGVGALKCMLMHRKKQPGDSSFNATWGTSSYWMYSWVAYSGISSFTTEAVFLSKNTAGTDLPTNSISYPAGSWAIGFFAALQITSGRTWTPDSAMTERVDLLRSGSPYLSMEIADTNGPVGISPKSFTAQSSGSFTYGLAGTVVAIPDSGFTGWGLPI